MNTKKYTLLHFQIRHLQIILLLIEFNDYLNKKRPYYTIKNNKQFKYLLRKKSMIIDILDKYDGQPIELEKDELEFFNQMHKNIKMKIMPFGCETLTSIIEIMLSNEHHETVSSFTIHLEHKNINMSYLMLFLIDISNPKNYKQEIQKAARKYDKKQHKEMIKLVRCYIGVD